MHFQHTLTVIIDVVEADILMYSCDLYDCDSNNIDSRCDEIVFY